MLTLGFNEVLLPGAVGKTTRPLGLPLVRDDDEAYVTAAITGSARQVGSVFQALAELALASDRRAVSDAAPEGSVDKVSPIGLEFAGELGPQLRESVDAVTAGKVDPLQLRSVAAKLTERFGPTGPLALAHSQPLAALRGSLAGTAMNGVYTLPAAGHLALQSLHAWLVARARLAEDEQALTLASATAAGVRGTALAQMLDCCSHRFDAWLTAPVARRMESQRAAGHAGVMLGAFGWVENLSPGPALTRDGGYLLTPSLGHAATAGVLRSAYLSHNRDGAGSGAFSIDLSGPRVRRALALVEGLTAGQPLGALLGYRLERLVREAGPDLERFVLPLRTLAPLGVGRLVGRAEAVPPQTREAIAANNVVDGVQLLHLRDIGTNIRDALAAAPTNNPYLTASGAWQPPTDDQWAAISAAIYSIADDRDAVADLLTAEGVHQLVRGNLPRAAAALDAAAGGDAPPSADMEVVHIPPRGTSVTHRVMLLLGDVAPGTGGWAGDSPRSLAEPRLAAWAETVLGPATQVVLQAAPDGSLITLGPTALAAIDVVYLAATPVELETLIRLSDGSLDPGPLSAVRNPAWPVGTVAYGELVTLATAVVRALAGAQPALPPAFARAGDPVIRSVAPGTLLDAGSRVRTAIAGLDQVIGTLAPLLAAPVVDMDALLAALVSAAGYGIPLGGDPIDPASGAVVVHREAVRRRDAAAAALTGTLTVAAAREAAQALFGGAFHLLITVSPAAPDLFSASIGRLHPLPSQMRRYLRDHAGVRPAAGNYSTTLTLGEALGRSRHLQVIQLCPAGTRGAGRWLALPFTGQDPSVTVPVTLILAESVPAAGAGAPLTGLVLDEWLEVLPTTVEHDDGVGGSAREQLITAAAAVNVDVPGARAPQTLLLAVAPDGNRWTTSGLAAVLTNALELTKIRAVTLERVPWAGRVLPALMEQSWSLQGEPTLDLTRLITGLSSSAFMAAYVKEPS